MLAGAKDESPLITLCPRGQMTTELFPVLVAEYFRRADEIGHDDVVVQGDGTVRVEDSPHFLAHRQYLRKLVTFVINMSPNTMFDNDTYIHR